MDNALVWIYTRRNSAAFRQLSCSALLTHESQFLLYAFLNHRRIAIGQIVLFWKPIAVDFVLH